MKADDFEQQLSRQHLRRVPAEWRQDILRAAVTRQTVSQQDPPTAPVVPWWRVWFWPCPQAWAGLAAAWALVLIFNSSAPIEPTTIIAQHVRPSREMIKLLQQQQRELAELLLPTATATVPVPPVNRPRSERRVTFITV